MIYSVEINKEQEEFLDLYLATYPLNPEHRKEDYPRLLVTNFINSMMKRRPEIEEVYKKKNRIGD